MKQLRKTKGRATDIDVEVGKMLRIRRSLLGMSQEYLSQKVGLTFQQIQKYEKGQNRISAGRLYDFSKVLDVPVSYFFKEAKSDVKPYETDELVFELDVLDSRETTHLLELYYSFENKEIRTEVLKFVKAVARIQQISSDEG